MAGVSGQPGAHVAGHVTWASGDVTDQEPIHHQHLVAGHAGVTAFSWTRVASIPVVVGIIGVLTY